MTNVMWVSDGGAFVTRERHGTVETMRFVRRSVVWMAGLSLLSSGCVAGVDALDFVSTDDGFDLRITTTALAVGEIERPYAAVVRATGGAMPRRWALVEGPPWLSGRTLDQDLVVSGVPDAPGRFLIRVEVQSDDGQRATAELTVRVVLPLTITTRRLPSARLGEPYDVDIAASGGRPELGYRWRLLTPPPPGLSINATGTPATRLTGAPTATGDIAFVVGVEDAVDSTRQELVLTVAAPGQLVVVAEAVPELVVGVPDVVVFRVNGGSGPYEWAVDGGDALVVNETTPDGDRLVVSLTPRSAGVRALDVGVADLDGRTGRQVFSLFVETSEVRIVTTTVPDGQQCLGYSVPLEATGSVSGRYVWSVDDGELPTGIRLVDDDGAAFLQGVFTNTGPESFALRATDPAGGSTAVQRYDIDVADGELNARHIAAVGNFDRPGQDVLVVDVCGPEPVSERIVSAQVVASSVGGPLAFSPDADQLAFVGTFRDPDRGELFVTRLEQGTSQPGVVRVPLADSEAVERFAWSPANDRMAVLVGPANRRVLIAASAQTSTIGLDDTAVAWSAGDDVLQWSPTGDHLAWMTRPTRGSLVVAPADGSASRPVSIGDGVLAFVWRTPRQLVYNQLNDDRTVDLFEVDIGTRAGPRLVASTSSGRVLDLHIAAGGDAMAYSGDANGFIRWVNDVPQPATSLVETSMAEVEQFAWAENAQRGILRRGEQASLVAVGPHGGIQRSVIEVPGGVVRDVGMTPDGRYGLLIAGRPQATLFFVDTQMTMAPMAIVASQPADTRLQGAFRFFSSPDSRRFAYTGEFTVLSRELYAVEVVAGMPAAPEQVTGVLTNATEVIGSPQWRPDGRTIFYMSTEASRGLPELWMVNFLGAQPSAPRRVSVVPRIASRVQRFAVPLR